MLRVKKNTSSVGQGGFSLVEILIVVCIVGVLLTLLVVSLNSKQKQLRDIKRISDIQTLRNALEVVKNENGSYARAYCSLGLVSECAGNQKSELLRYMLNLGQLNDPEEDRVNCAKNCQDAPCNYTLMKLEEVDYEVRFHLEHGVDGYSQAGCYAAGPRGIMKVQ